MPRLPAALVSLSLVIGVAMASLPAAPPLIGRASAIVPGNADTAGGMQLQPLALPDLGEPGGSQGLCDGVTGMLLERSDFCTHGPDPAPPGFDVDVPVAPLRETTARAAAAETLACDGDGQSGYRIQVLYVHGSDTPSRYERFRQSLQSWVAEADEMFRESAAETGGSRGLRLVHDANCAPAITPVQLSPAGDGAFDRTIAELKDRGYSRRDRIYLAFVDSTAAGICGIGTSWSDDRANGRLNRNNIGPGYARVDAGCWGGDTAAHELMHTFGGVQHSAPNASGGFHCIDEWDLMCYKDGPSTTTRIDCPSRSRDKSRFDCNHDDYFNTNPAPGSYLATHWNTANNRFLIGAPSPAVDRGKNDNAKKKGKNQKKGGKKGKNKNGGKNSRR